MKTLITLFMLIASVSFGQFPYHSNIATADVQKVTGNYDQFEWKWCQYDSQSNVFYTKNGSAALDVSGYDQIFRIGKPSPTGMVSWVTITNGLITKASTKSTFTVNLTNVPPVGSYIAELYFYADSATNVARTLTQGKITVFLGLGG